MVVSPAVRWCDAVPVRYQFEFLKEPLILQLFSLEDNSWFYSAASCGDSLNKRRPSARLNALQQRLLLRVRAPDYEAVQGSWTSN